MISLILFVFSAFVLAYILLSGTDISLSGTAPFDSYQGGCKETLIRLAIAIVFLILPWFFWLRYVTSYPSESVPHLHYTDKLVALKDNSGIYGEISGSFIHIDGKIESAMYFNGYRENSDGSFQPIQISANNLRIIEEEGNVIPRIEHFQDKWGNYNELSWIMKIERFGEFISGSEYQIAYVPVGSIESAYNLDSK